MSQRFTAIGFGIGGLGLLASSQHVTGPRFGVLARELSQVSNIAIHLSRLRYWPERPTASLRPGDGERWGEGRKNRREFKEHGNKCAVGDSIIWPVDFPLRCLRSRSFASILI